MQLGKFSSGSGQQAPSPGWRPIKIGHGTGEFFILGDTQALGKSLNIIGLGLIRSRIYWPDSDLDSSSRKPICKSHDGVEGIPRADVFPWEESEFANVASNTKLPCASCTFKGWLPNEKQPRCNSTWTIPAIVPALTETGEEHEIFTMPFTASSIPNLEEYLIPLRDKGIPMYSRVTSVNLKKVSKGDRIWSKAEFELDSFTDERSWPTYSRMLHRVRDYMQPKNEGAAFTPLPLGN